MIEDGWIKLWRKFLDWEWFSDAKMVQLFLYLLLSASIKQRKWKGIVLERGQLVTTYPELSKKTRQSVKNLRTALDRLEEGQIIGRQPTNKYTIITICNFDSYQTKEEPEWQTNGRQTAGQGQTNGRQTAGIIAEEKEECREEVEHRNNNNTLSLRDTARPRARFSLKQLTDEERSVEEAAFQAAMFWGNALYPTNEVKKFIAHNERSGWQSRADDDGHRILYDTPEQRVALAEAWVADDRCEKGRMKGIKLWRLLFDNSMQYRPDLAPHFVKDAITVDIDPSLEQGLKIHCPDVLREFFHDDQGRKVISKSIAPGWTLSFTTEKDTQKP